MKNLSLKPSKQTKQEKQRKALSDHKNQSFKKAPKMPDTRIELTTLLCKEIKTKSDILKIISLFDQDECLDISYNKEINDRVVHAKMNLLDIYIYLQLCRSGIQSINLEYFENIVLHLHSFNVDLDLINREIFDRIITLFCFIVELNNNDIFIIKKIFYLIFSIILKRRNFAPEIKIKAFDAFLKILEFYKDFNANEIFEEYINIDDFMIIKTTFNKHVFINYIMSQINYKNNIKKENFYKMKMQVLLSLQNQEHKQIFISTAESSDVKKETETFFQYNLFLSLTIIEEYIEVCSDFYRVYENIFMFFKKDRKISEFIINLLEIYDINNLHDFLKKILVVCLEKLKENISKNFSIFKALAEFDLEYLNQAEINAFNSYLVSFYHFQPYRSKEIILKMLASMKYTKFFELINIDISSESVLLKKAIFRCSIASMDSKEIINDFVRIYLSFLQSDSMRDYVIATFDYESLFSNLQNINDTYEYKEIFINTLCKYIYFYDEKYFLKHIEIDIVNFIPKTEDIFRMKFLKHFVKYRKNEFIEYQTEFISLLRIKKSNLIFIDDILSILIEIADGLTNISQVQILEILLRMFQYSFCSRKIGLLLKKIYNNNSTLANVNIENILIIPFINPEKYIKDLNYNNANNTVHPQHIKSFMYYIEENKQNFKIHEKQILDIFAKIFVYEPDSNEFNDIFYYDLINHVLFMTDEKNDKPTSTEFYTTIILTYIKQFLKLVLHKQKSIAIKSYRLITRFLEYGYILPHSCIPELICYNTVFFNPSFTNIVTLYSIEIINQLDLIQHLITEYFNENTLKVDKGSLSYAFIYNSLKNEKFKEKFLTKCLSIIDNYDIFSTYFILKNIIMFHMTKKVKGVVLQHVNNMLDYLQIVYAKSERKYVILKYSVLMFKKNLRYKLDFNIGEELLYDGGDGKNNGVIERLENELLGMG